MAKDQDIGAAARQAGSELRHLRSSMPSFVELAVFVVLLAISFVIAILVGQANAALGVFVGVVGAIAAALVAASIKIANQWERGSGAPTRRVPVDSWARAVLRRANH